ncbi:MAG: heme exporter protein CcmB [Cytophagaceae bacterium]
MSLYSETIALIRKEILLEWRQRFALNGILLYLGSIVFICYLSLGVKTNGLSPIVWNALFWIILLFTSVNAVAKSFMQEKASRLFYYYSITSAKSVIISKIIYNAGLMLLLSLIGFLFYSLVLGNPVKDQSLFLMNIVLGAIGFSCTFTMVSGIASKAGGNATLMAILSFPIILPLLLLLIKISKNAMDGLNRGSSWDEVIMLLAINVMITALSYILFPYLWRS